jgi:hypothetical protein
MALDLPPKVVPMVKLVPAAASRIAARPVVPEDDIQGSCGVGCSYTPFSSVRSRSALLSGKKDLPVQQFVAHLAVERFDIAILPGTTGLNEKWLHVQLC